MNEEADYASAFSICESHNWPSDNFTIDLENSAGEVIKSGEPLELPNSTSSIASFPPYLYLLIRIFAALLKSATPEKTSKKYIDSIFTNPLITDIKLSLLKLIAEIIEKKLYHCEDHVYFESLSYISLFKSCLLPYFLSLVTTHSTVLKLQNILEFVRVITGSNSSVMIPISLFNLYGGKLFTIEAKTFKRKFSQLIKVLATVFSSGNTLLTRCATIFSTDPAYKIMIDESIRIVTLARAPSALLECSVKLTLSIFGSRDYIGKDEFVQKVSEHSQYQLLSFYLNYLSLEFKTAENEIFEKAVANKPLDLNNFYKNELQKILSKCPYNGDILCACKKCQCVRRNRESAKVSQEKKRKAVEKVDTLQERLNELELRNNELEEENRRLKFFIDEMSELDTFKPKTEKYLDCLTESNTP